MSLAPSRPFGDVDAKLGEEGFRPSSLSVVDPAEIELCTRLHCQRCGEPELDCRGYERHDAEGQAVRTVAVCRRCEAAEVLPRTRAGWLLRRADERAGLAAVGAVVAMGLLLGVAAAVHGSGAQIAVVLLILVPVGLLAYLARNGPGGGAGGDFPVGGI